MLRIWQIVDRTRVNFNWLDDFCKYKLIKSNLVYFLPVKKKKSRPITIMVFKVLETNNLSMTTSRRKKKKKKKLLKYRLLMLSMVMELTN